MSPLQWLLAALSPGARRGRLSILIFHRVLPSPDPLFPGEPDAARFDELCGWMRQLFNVLPLDEAVMRLQAGTLPARAAVISFDDGYADNHDVAMPILQRHGLTAAFFVSTGYLDGGLMWNDAIIEAVRTTDRDALRCVDAAGVTRQWPLGDAAARRRAIDGLIGSVKYLDPDLRHERVSELVHQAGRPSPTDLMLTSDKVRRMRKGGMLIGGHTVSHPILAKLEPRVAQGEIETGRRRLQDLLGEPIEYFAYPNGKPGSDYLREHVEMVQRAGFKAALSTSWGSAARGADLHQLPRFTPWDRSRTGFGLRLARNLLARGETLT